MPLILLVLQSNQQSNRPQTGIGSCTWILWNESCGDVHIAKLLLWLIPWGARKSASRCTNTTWTSTEKYTLRVRDRQEKINTCLPRHISAVIVGWGPTSYSMFWCFALKWWAMKWKSHDRVKICPTQICSGCTTWICPLTFLSLLFSLTIKYPFLTLTGPL